MIARIEPSLDSENSPETTEVEKEALAAAFLGVTGDVCWTSGRFIRAEEGEAWSPLQEFEHLWPLVRALEPHIVVTPDEAGDGGQLCVHAQGQRADVRYTHDFAEALRHLLVHVAAMVHLSGPGNPRRLLLAPNPVALSDIELTEQAAVVAGVDGQRSADGREYLCWPDHYCTWEPLTDSHHLMRLMSRFAHNVQVVYRHGEGFVQAQGISKQGRRIVAEVPFQSDPALAFARAVVTLASQYLPIRR